DPLAILHSMLAGAVEVPEAERGAVLVEPDRARAIAAAVALAHAGDCVLVAGKGHEQTQTIGARVLPFHDVDEVKRALAGVASPAFLDLGAVVSETQGTLHGALAGGLTALAGVSTDSRAVTPRSLFVALAGEHFDAHTFAEASLRAGAGAVLVSRAHAATQGIVEAGHGAAIVVDDTLVALQALARAHVAKLAGTRIALTGSNGKTTTKELIAASLKAALGAPYVVTTAGNLNNHIGVPLTALVCEPEHKALVFEMGMNHEGEIALLADIVKPAIGLITNIGTAHQGNFADGAVGVARAKSELFAALPKSGVAVVNADDPQCIREAQRVADCKHVSFGWASWADVRLVNVSDRESGGQDLTLMYAGQSVDVAIPLEGRHNAQNAAGAVAVAVAAGLPFDVCARGLAQVHKAHGRLERITLRGDVWLLDDTYNANPDSMEAALYALVEIAGTRKKIIVLGEMRELGAYAEQEHRHVGAGAGAAGAHTIFACGELGKLYLDGARSVARTKLPGSAPAPQLSWALTNTELAQMVVSAVGDGDVVLVKGSRGARMEVVVDALVSARSRENKR
ncbi:MAG TPA: UDP-N-acetylmuramoyl-tripeptide--D-alanyl-D-alanine ligase, partial [Myxococcota bacterium]